MSYAPDEIIRERGLKSCSSGLCDGKHLGTTTILCGAVLLVLKFGALTPPERRQPRWGAVVQSQVSVFDYSVFFLV